MKTLEGKEERGRRNKACSEAWEIEGHALELRRGFQSEEPQAPFQWHPRSSYRLDFHVPSPPPLQSGAVVALDAVALFVPVPLPWLPSQRRHPPCIAPGRVESPLVQRAAGPVAPRAMQLEALSLGRLLPVQRLSQPALLQAPLPSSSSVPVFRNVAVLLRVAPIP
jgi:hypothetical protein